MNSVRSRSTGFLFGSLLLVTLVWWGCGGDSGQENGSASSTPTADEAPAADAGNAGTQVAQAEPSMELGKQVYEQRCTICHGMTGKGDGPAGKALNPPPRDHTDKAYMSKMTDEEIRTTILNGKNAMPPHKGLLTEAEVTSVVMYVRSLGA